MDERRYQCTGCRGFSEDAPARVIVKGPKVHRFCAQCAAVTEDGEESTRQPRSFAEEHALRCGVAPHDHVLEDPFPLTDLPTILVRGTSS